MSIYFGEFQPHKVPNTGLYIQRKDSTVSLCPDYSPNGYNFAQAVAANQPSLSANSIDFTTNDFMINNTANVFSGDNSGYIFFSGYFNSAAVNRIISSADNGSAFLRRFDILINNTNNKIQLNVRNGGVSANVITLDTTVLTNGDYYYGWIRSDGSVYTAKLNGVTQTIVASLSNDGVWFSGVTSRDNLVIGAIIGTSIAYGSAQINKVHYVSGSPSALDVWKIEQFFSNPLNYI
jgi:hypothetical protein